MISNVLEILLKSADVEILGMTFLIMTSAKVSRISLPFYDKKCKYYFLLVFVICL